MTDHDYRWIDDQDKAECLDRVVNLPHESATEMTETFLRRQAVQLERCRSIAWRNSIPEFTSRMPMLEGEGVGVTLSATSHSVANELAIYNQTRVAVRGSMVRLGSDSLHVVARLKVAIAADSEGCGTCLVEARPGLSGEHRAGLDAYLDKIGAFRLAPESHVCAACNTRRNRQWLSVVLDRETSRMWTVGSDCEELVLGFPAVSPFRWDRFCQKEGPERMDRIDPQPVFLPTAFKVELVLSIYHELAAGPRAGSDLPSKVKHIKSPHERFAAMARIQMSSGVSWFSRRFCRSAGLDYSTVPQYVNAGHPIVRQLLDPQNKGYLPITTKKELDEHSAVIEKLFNWAEDCIGPSQDIPQATAASAKPSREVDWPWVEGIWRGIDLHKKNREMEKAAKRV